MDRERILGSAVQIQGEVTQAVAKAVGDAKLEFGGQGRQGRGQSSKYRRWPQRRAQREIGVEELGTAFFSAAIGLWPSSYATDDRLTPMVTRFGLAISLADGVGRKTAAISV